MTVASPARRSGATRLLRRLSRAVAIVGLAAWAIGSAVALATRAPDLFHRFGALGVAASVLFFTDRLLRIELARQRAVERLLHEYGVELEAMRAGTPPTELPRHGYIIDYLVEERRFGALRQTADRFQAANIGLLTVSTLQWGFGDLLLSALTEGGA
ncbi:MAG: hypothetical protein V2I65_18385 [Paracoccaceae bacterium]|jgi:hypothetical protein|nr:hypothetical protein [Paracoccaceae bacterium]